MRTMKPVAYLSRVWMSSLGCKYSGRNLQKWDQALLSPEREIFVVNGKTEQAVACKFNSQMLNSRSSVIWSAVPSAPLKFFKVSSNGKAALKGSMTYSTTHRRSESDKLATEGQEGSQRV